MNNMNIFHINLRKTGKNYKQNPNSRIKNHIKTEYSKINLYYMFKLK